MGAFFSLFSSSSASNESNKPLLGQEEKGNDDTNVSQLTDGQETQRYEEDKNTPLKQGDGGTTTSQQGDGGITIPQQGDGGTTTSQQGDGGITIPQQGEQEEHNINSPKISIITSHQGRMRCFLNMMLNDEDKNTPFQEEEKKGEQEEHNKKINNVSAKKFKNGAIVKVTISKEGCTIELVYEGELAGNTDDSKYYNHNNKYTPEYEYSAEIYTPEKYKEPNLILCQLNLQDTINKLDLNNEDIGDNTYIFYLVRHGYAQHNARGVNLEKDTELKDEGKKQAKRAGIFLKGELGENPPNIRYYTSDLHRTIQTMAYIMHELEVKEPSEMTVLPCNHEIDSTKPPCIDKSKMRSLPFIRRENKTLRKSEQPGEQYGEIKIPIGNNGGTIKYKVNWKLYNDNKERKMCYKGGKEQIFVTTAFHDFHPEITGDHEGEHRGESKDETKTGGGKTQKRKKIRRKRTKRLRSKKTHNKRKTKKRSKKRKLKVTKSQKLKKIERGY